MRWIWMPQDDVAAALSVPFVAEAPRIGGLPRPFSYQPVPCPLGSFRNGPYRTEDARLKRLSVFIASSIPLRPAVPGRTILPIRECLSMQWFKNRVDAMVLIEDWRREYNTVRPHSSLGSLTPTEFAERMKSTVQKQAIF